MHIICIFLSITLLVGPLYGNVGVFTGHGHTIELSSTESIQMVSEEVTIVPGRGMFHFDGGVAGMDRVEYDCTFTLKNLEDKEVQITAGFPLNSQFLDPPYDKETKTSDLVARYSFIAQADEKQYSVRYAAGDKDKKLKNLFLWEMKFSASETKIVRVTYAMPISMTLASSSVDWKKSDYQKDWYEGLETGMLEWFGYVTETGNSWAGTIEKATFRVYVQGFEEYLMGRPFMEGMSLEEATKTKEHFPVWSPTIFRITEPGGWKDNGKEFLALTYEDYQPSENLTFYYYLFPLPQTREDAIRLVESLGNGSFDKSDYEDLTDILREFNGEETGNQRIKKFLKNQRWFGKAPFQKVPEEAIQAINEMQS